MLATLSTQFVREIHSDGFIALKPLPSFSPSMGDLLIAAQAEEAPIVKVTFQDDGANTYWHYIVQTPEAGHHILSRVKEFICSPLRQPLQEALGGQSWLTVNVSDPIWEMGRNGLRRAFDPRKLMQYVDLVAEEFGTAYSASGIFKGYKLLGDTLAAIVSKIEFNGKLTPEEVSEILPMVLSGTKLSGMNMILGGIRRTENPTPQQLGMATFLEAAIAELESVVIPQREELQAMLAKRIVAAAADEATRTSDQFSDLFTDMANSHGITAYSTADEINLVVRQLLATFVGNLETVLFLLNLIQQNILRNQDKWAAATAEVNHFEGELNESTLRNDNVLPELKQRVAKVIAGWTAAFGIPRLSTNVYEYQGLLVPEYASIFVNMARMSGHDIRTDLLAESHNDYSTSEATLLVYGGPQFGAGPQKCVGAPLAFIEIFVATMVMLKNQERMKLVSEPTLEYGSTAEIKYEVEFN